MNYVTDHGHQIAVINHKNRPLQWKRGAPTAHPQYMTTQLDRIAVFSALHLPHQLPECTSPSQAVFPTSDVFSGRGSCGRSRMPFPLDLYTSHSSDHDNKLLQFPSRHMIHPNPSNILLLARGTATVVQTILLQCTGEEHSQYQWRNMERKKKKTLLNICGLALCPLQALTWCQFFGMEQ